MTPSSRPRRLVAGACAAAMLSSLALTPSQAATTTATFTVTANVLTTCNVDADNLHFGNYSGVEIDATTTVTATCSTGTPYTVALSPGTSPAATVTTRKMTPLTGTDTLSYSLSQDAAHSVNWGNTPGTDTPAQATGTGTPQQLTVFGRIPAGQFPGPGAYSRHSITGHLGVPDAVRGSSS